MEYTTSDNRTIKFIKGYYDNPYPYPFGIKTLSDFLKFGKGNYPDSDAFFFNKLAAANSVEQLLKDLRLKSQGYQKLLDICSGPGILPRALKARNVVTTAHAMDLTIREQDYPMERINQLWSKPFNVMSKSDSETRRIPYESITSHIIGKNHAFAYLFEDFDETKLDIDHYQEVDFLDYQGDGYDLVTLISGIEYFNADDFFSKLSQMMAPEGIFVTSNVYFYELLAGSMYLPADVPWMHAMLTKDDYMSYIAKHHPKDLENVKETYYFPTTHFVVDDFVASAEKYGLEAIFTKKSIRNEHFNLFNSQPAPLQMVKETILPHCKSINPKVNIDDLMTTHFTMVFRKKIS